MGIHGVLILIYLVKLVIIRYEGKEEVMAYMWMELDGPYLQTLLLMLLSLILIYYLHRHHVKDAFIIKEEKEDKVTSGYMTKAKYDVKKADDKGWKDVISSHVGKDVDEIGVPEETMLECPNCETMVPSDVDVCPSCGVTFVWEEEEEEAPAEETTETGRKKKLTSFVGSGGVVKHEEEKDDDVREIGYTPDEEEDLEPKEKYTPKTPPPKPVKEEGPQLEWVECPFCLAFVEYRGDSCPKCGELWEGEALRVQLKCPKCGKILEKETPSCNCGYKFEK